MIDLASELDLDTIRVPLTRFLLSQASNSQRTSKRWTVSEIAAHLGTQISAIERALQLLAREGLIRPQRGQLVVVTELARLEHKAMGSSKSKAKPR
jgi:DNA-binding MarR family transcriptional regulator